jgi:hypothetical protein
MCHDIQGAIAGRGAVLYLDQRFHLLDRHPEIAGVPDQDQPFNILVLIGPVTALRSGASASNPTASYCRIVSTEQAAARRIAEGAAGLRPLNLAA